MGKPVSAIEGTIAKLPGTSKQIEVSVKPSCGGEAGHWFCITHKMNFSNNFMKDDHLNIIEGDHIMCWICHEHGPEVP